MSNWNTVFVEVPLTTFIKSLRGNGGNNIVGKEKLPKITIKNKGKLPMERQTGLEPATLSLGS